MFKYLAFATAGIAASYIFAWFTARIFWKVATPSSINREHSNRQLKKRKEEPKVPRVLH